MIALSTVGTGAVAKLLEMLFGLKVNFQLQWPRGKQIAVLAVRILPWLFKLHLLHRKLDGADG